MNNLSINNIRKNLCNKFNSIRSNSSSDLVGIFLVNCKRLVDYIENNPMLNTIKFNIEKVDVDFDKWKDFLRTGIGNNDFLGHDKNILICWKVLKRISELNGYQRNTNDISELLLFGSILMFRSNDGRDNHLNVITNRYIEPLIDFFLENLDSELMVLYYIERFIRRCREFDKIELYNLCESKSDEEKIKQGEKKLDKTLRKYLFDNEIDTIYTPKFSEGFTDIMTESSKNFPESIVLEVKLFKNTSNYNEKYLKDGFSSQLQPAVNSFGRNYGILFVYNLSDKYINFNTPIGGNPPRMIIGGKTYYFIHTDIYPHQSSSSNAKVETIQINCSNWVLNET